MRFELKHQEMVFFDKQSSTASLTALVINLPAI